MLCYAWGHLQDREPARLAGLGNLSTAQDLLGKVLAGGTNRLLRRGIDSGYAERREDIAGIRGKVAITDTAKRALRARGRVACEFEELSADILPNRILRASLRAMLLPEIELDSQVRAEIRSAYLRLDGISPIRLNRHSFGRIRLGSNRRLYRFLVSVCRLVYESMVVSEKSGDTTFLDFRREESTMWKLFEDFVTGFYEREQTSYRVNANGRRIHWADFWAYDELSRSRIPAMEADVILESPERRIILDTKFYRETLGSGRNRQGGKLHSANLYQLLAYLRNREAGVPTGALHEGILLYPKNSKSLRADIRLEGFRIQARTVNLNQNWQQIRCELLETIGVWSH